MTIAEATSALHVAGMVIRAAEAERDAVRKRYDAVAVEMSQADWAYTRATKRMRAASDELFNALVKGDGA